MRDRQQCVDVAKAELEAARQWTSKCTDDMLSELGRFEWSSRYATDLLAHALAKELRAQRLEQFIKSVPTIPFDQDVESALNIVLHPAYTSFGNAYEEVERRLRVFSDELRHIRWY
jgi:hypothetical protein